MVYINKLKKYFWSQFRSIKNKIFYFSFLISLSMILLILLIAYFISYNTIKNTSITREQNSLELIANKTDLILSSAESQATSLIVNEDIQKILSDSSVNNIAPDKNSILDVNRHFNNTMYKNSVISGLILRSTNEFIFQSDSTFISLLQLDNGNIDFNKWYGSIKDMKNKNYIYLPKKIFDMNTGKLIGYLEIFIDESTLSKNHTDFFLVNEEGFITAASSKQEINNNIYEIDSNIQVADKITPFKTIYNREKNEIVLMLYHPRLNWNIITSIHLEDIIYEKESLIIALILLSILALICCYSLSKLISKSITNPINNLYNAIDEVEQGNWSTKIHIISYDEIGILSKKFNHLISYINNLLSKINYEQNKKKEFELELIQLQIKPHFLYNSLENISALAELERNDDVVDMISNLSTFYRGVLNKGNNVITLKEELSLTESYLKIMKLRYYDIFDYSINCDKSLYEHSCLKLLIQPLVENSIYHGLKNCSKKGEVLISVSKFYDTINIIIEDSGIGMDEFELQKLLNGTLSSSKKGGFAVKNTIERLTLYYPHSNSFHIESKKNVGTKIIIKIPAIRKELYYDKCSFS